MLYLSMIEDQADRDKFNTVYENYYRLMLSVAYDILRNYHDAEDAVHSAFMRIMKNMEKIGDPECHKTKGFVVIVVGNVAKSMYNRLHKVTVVELEDHHAVEENSVVEEAERHWDSDMVKRAMERLPEKYREVLLLKFLYDCSYKTMAQILYAEEATLRKQVQRAKQLLREQVEQTKEGEDA